MAPTTEPTALVSFGDRSYSVRAEPYEEDSSVEIPFVIKASGGRVRVGEFTLDFGPDAVCDPATSGYGEGFWKQPCTAVGADFNVTAKVFTSQGKSFVDFYPDIRFNPATQVIASAVRIEIIGERMTKKKQRLYDIWYTKRTGKDRLYIDEAWNDPDLRTFFDTTNGRVWRQIRHFSGIVIHVGYCTEFPDDPSCTGIY
ncbi:MAG: hypothetical protein WD825_16735 [Gemmatimonadaceae bacterium]